MARLTLIFTVLTTIVALLGGFRMILELIRRWRWKSHEHGRWLSIIIVLLWPTLSWGQACTVTLNPGANLDSEIPAAAAGAVVCLNSGDYGSPVLMSFTKSPRVTMRSTTGQGATMYLRLYSDVNGLTIKSINFTGGLTIGAAGSADGANNRNITIHYSNFGTAQFVLATTNFNNNNILIDNNTFGKFNAIGGFEGRMQFTGASANPSGITVSNNTFGPEGCSDGIQVGSRGVTIGPGNIFSTLAPNAECDAIYGGRQNVPHIDAIQGYGQDDTVVTGNYFTENLVDLGFYDGGSNEQFTNNVFNHSAVDGQAVQLGSIQGGTFTHNTLVNVVAAQGAKTGDPLNNNFSWLNNVLVGSSIIDAGDQPGCSPNCPVDYNLFTANPRGTNYLVGTPTFSGGGSPSTWSGFLLASGSLGENAGNDGLDMGITGSAPDTSNSIVIFIGSWWAELVPLVGLLWHVRKVIVTGIVLVASWTATIGGIAWSTTKAISYHASLSTVHGANKIIERIVR